MRYIDVTVPLRTGQVVWPSDPGLQIRWRSTIEKDGANISEICLGMHTATHVDSSLHFIPGGRTIDQVPPDELVGPCQVVSLPGIGRITAPDLEAKRLPADCRRLLLRTDASRYWVQRDTTFHADFPALMPDAAEWIVRRGIRLVGIDYLSIEPYHWDMTHPVHHILLGAEVVVIETLDLSQVAEGAYQLICLPLKIEGSEGAPARVLLGES